MPGPSAAPRALAERAAGCGGRRTDRGRKGMRAGVQVESNRCPVGRGWPRSSWARATEYPPERQSPACTMQRILGPDARQATGDIGLCLNVQRLRAASANVPCHELHGALHPPRHRDSLAAEACAKAFGARLGLPPCTRFFRGWLVFGRRLEGCRRRQCIKVQSTRNVHLLPSWLLCSGPPGQQAALMHTRRPQAGPSSPRIRFVSFYAPDAGVSTNRRFCGYCTPL